MLDNIFTEQAAFVLVVILGLALFIAFRAQVYSVYRRQEHNTIAAWQKFAQSNELSFNSGNFFQWNVHIKGIYRDHFIELYTTMHKDDKEERQRSHPFTHYNRSFRQGVILSPNTYFCTHACVVPSPSRLAENSPPVTFATLKGVLSPQQIIDLLIPGGLVCHSRKNVEITIDREKIRYKQDDFEANQAYLARLADMLCDIAENQAKIIALGSEAISTLQNIADHEGHSLGTVSQYLLEMIAEQSQILQAEKPKLLCPGCLVHFTKQEIKLSLKKKRLTYYGCPRCQQNREYFSGQVIALLDEEITEARVKDDDKLKVNWLLYRELFDFEQVEIGQATDEEVERFAIQVGNDTQAGRKFGYKLMVCKIFPQSQLSENTKRILRHLFGQVEVVSGPPEAR